MFQAKIKSGERERELSFKIAWSKVTKQHDAEPVLEPKDHSYLEEMMCDVIEQSEKVTSIKEGDQPSTITSKPCDTRHIMAPVQRPSGQDVIKERIRLSRFKTKKDDL